MSDTIPEYLKHFGEIKFAEEKSMSASDFERALNRHMKNADKKPRGRYKFAEIGNSFTKDFEDSFNEYFE